MMTTTTPTIQRYAVNEAADIASDLRQRGYGSKRAALHLRYDTMDLTLEMLLATEDLPANARSVIAEIVAFRNDQARLEREGEELEREDEEVAQAEARDAETARQNDLWDAGAEQRYQDELQDGARRRSEVIMTSMLKAEDQILYVPAGVDRRGRSAHQLAGEEATTEEGFVTSVRQQTAFCRFFRPGGLGLRTVANSEACNVADLMPLTRPGRDDFFVLSEALAAFIEPDRDERNEADLAAAAKRSVELEHGPLAASLAVERATETGPANWSAQERQKKRAAAKLLGEPDPFTMDCPECHGTKKVKRLDLSPGDGPGVVEEVVVTCPRCKGSGRIGAFDFGIRTATVARGRGASEAETKETRDDEAAGRIVELRHALGRQAS